MGLEPRIVRLEVRLGARYLMVGLLYWIRKIITRE